MLDGKKITKLREEKGLTTYELAEKVFCSQSMIIHIEHEVRSPSIELLKRLADLFSCTVDELLKDALTAKSV